MLDTTDEAERVQLAAIRAMSPGERLRQALELSETMRQLTLVGLRARHPGLSDSRLVALLLESEAPPTRRPTP